MLRVTLLALAVAGCTVHDPCAANTVLVAVTLNGTTSGASELLVSVALDGGPARAATLPHHPGSGAGNIVVQFPSGYPHGHQVTIAVAARDASAQIGLGSVVVSLQSGCEAVALTVKPTIVPVVPDLAVPPDLAVAPVIDLAQASDLSAPDLAHCVPTTENCFNGIDDDCDGHIDCDDSDCASIAVCVPAVTGPFSVGTTLDPVSLCPQSYSSLEVVMSGLSAAASNCSTGCSCGVTCQVQLGSFNTVADCNSDNTDNESGFSVVYDTMCNSWSSWNATLVVPTIFTPTTCTLSGTPVLPMTSWAASERFCAAISHGGGCGTTKICVPVTPGPNCEIAAGTQTCDTGYNAVSGPWYTGKDDQRMCQCSCGGLTGSCGSNIALHTDNNCNSTATTFAANARYCSATGPFHSGKIEITPPTCNAPTYLPETGTLMGTGLQTLCCVP
jgi:hypothetical protein